MEFRWVALIALWTLISGPMFGTSGGPRSPARVPGQAAAVKVATPAAQPPR